MSDNSSNAEPCAVCLETFKDPRQLSCGHVFCRKCIQNLIDGSKPFLCPKCRKNHSSLTRAADLSKYKYTTVNEKPKESSNVNANPFSTCELCKVEEPWKRFAYCSNHDHFMCTHCALFQHKTCSVITAQEGASQCVTKNITKARDMKLKVTSLATVVRKLDESQEKLTKVVVQQDDQISQVQNCLDRNLQLFDEAMSNESAMAALITQRKLELASSELNSSNKTYSEMVETVCKEASDLMSALENVHSAFENVHGQYCNVVAEKIKLVSNPHGYNCQQLIPALQQLAAKANLLTPAAIVKEALSAIRALKLETYRSQVWVAVMGKDLILGSDTSRPEYSQVGILDFGNGFKLLFQNGCSNYGINYMKHYGNEVDQARIDEYLVTATKTWRVVDGGTLNSLATNATGRLGGGIWCSVADPYGSRAIARHPPNTLFSGSVEILGFVVTLYKLGDSY